jgi:peptide-methionine (S)-S-oxide reductase
MKMAEKKAVFGAGCFWGVEVDFRNVPGVTDVEAGYAGGQVDDPDYRTVCSGATGHAEVVEVTYDPEEVSYDELLDVFFGIHDPTQLNRQGPDRGSQYRTVVFTEDEAEADAVRRAITRNQPRFSRPIVTEVAARAPFWRAEEYHQQYLVKAGRATCRI